MARENATYRLQLEQIIAQYPDKEILSRTDIMKYTGRGRKWLDSHGFAGRTDFTRVQVAHILSGIK